MGSIYQKLKIVTFIWACVSVFGGVVVTVGLNQNVAALGSVFILFVIYFFASNWFSLPIRNVDKEVVEKESYDFLVEVELLKNRATQICTINERDECDSKPYNIGLAYKKALFSTIVYGADENSSVVYFTKYFKEIINSESSKIEGDSLDKLVLDISKKRRKTKLQREYLSFVSSRVVGRSKHIEELSFVFKIIDGHLSVKGLFNNYFGFSLIKFMRLIDINSSRMGLKEFTDFELPGPKNTNKFD